MEYHGRSAPASYTQPPMIALAAFVLFVGAFAFETFAATHLPSYVTLWSQIATGATIAALAVLACNRIVLQSQYVTPARALVLFATLGVGNWIRAWNGAAPETNYYLGGALLGGAIVAAALLFVRHTQLEASHRVPMDHSR